MDKLLKKPIMLTVALIVVLIIILAISNSNTTVNVFAIVVLLALVALVWVKYLQEKKAPTKEPVIPVSSAEPSVASSFVDETEEDLKTKTGAPCEKAGVYVCKDHPKRTVKMKKGNRFPPCRGEKKGHSTVWILKG